MLNPLILKINPESYNLRQILTFLLQGSILRFQDMYKQDSFAYLTDAFSVHWGLYKSYLFSPFSVTGSTLQKIRADHAQCVKSVRIWSYSGPHFPPFGQKPEELHLRWSKLTLLISRKVSEKFN